MVILTQYHTEIQNRGISTIGASEIFPVSRMPRFQRFHCMLISNFTTGTLPNKGRDEAFVRKWSVAKRPRRRHVCYLSDTIYLQYTPINRATG